MYVHNTMPRDRYNAKKRAQYEKRKAEHLPRLREIANTMSFAQMATATGTTIAFVNRVVKEEGLRDTTTRGAQP